MLALLVLCALAGEDGHPVVSVTRVHAGSTWSLADGVLSRDSEPVAQGVIGAPAFGGRAVAVARVVEEPVGTELVVFEQGKARVLVGLEARPDRVSLTPDGAFAAYVSGRTGLASVWIVDLRDGATRQLTNVGVRPAKGSAPAGFVPPPLDPPRFEGSLLVWESPTGAQQVSWR